MDIGMGQVVGPDGGRRGAGLEIDGTVTDRPDRSMPSGGSPGSPCGRSRPRSSRRRDRWGRTRPRWYRPPPGSDPSSGPAEDRGLEQVAARHRTPDLHRVVLARRTADLDGDVVVGALGVSAATAWPGRGRRHGPQRRTRPRSGRTSLAPEASSATVSLVDWQPSESSRSKVRRVAARSAASHAAASTSASVVSTTSMVASAGASMPAPLAMPPTVQPPGERCAAAFGRVSVVMIARAASSPPVVAERGGRRHHPGEDPLPAEQRPDQAGGADQHVHRRDRERRPTSSAVACVTWNPPRPV